MNLSHTAYHKIVQSWWLLKLTYGLLFVVAGADKFLNLVTNWSKYISPYVLKMVPLSVSQLMMGTAVFEIILGVLILAVATRLGAYIAMAWLLLIAVNLLSFGLGVYVDIAVRDIVMAIAALVLAMLTHVHEEPKGK